MLREVPMRMFSSLTERINVLREPKQTPDVSTGFRSPCWAYGKPGNPEPEPEPEPELESGTGTGTGEINEWFKLGSMIDINTPPPLSAFFARWMTIR